MLSEIVEETERSETLLVGLRIRASLNEIIQTKAGGRLREELAARAEEISHKAEDGIFLVQLYDGPGWTPETPFTQFVGKAVERVEQIPEGMTVYTIPSGRFLRFEHQGPESGIGASYDAMNAWMRDNQRNCAAPFDFEYWQDITTLEDPDTRIPIHMPVR